MLRIQPIKAIGGPVKNPKTVDLNSWLQKDRNYGSKLKMLGMVKKPKNPETAARQSAERKKPFFIVDESSRLCLRCRKEFTSEGKWNRMCGPCARKNAFIEC